MRPAPLPELARPARSRIPAITGAEPATLRALTDVAIVARYPKIAEAADCLSG